MTLSDFRADTGHPPRPALASAAAIINVAVHGRSAGGGPVLIASNRGPVSFSRGDDGRLLARRGGGGMVSGLSAVADETDMLWVCAALSDDDRAAARLAPDGPRPGRCRGGAAVRMLDIPQPIFHRAYNAVANSTLWFVHHMLYDTPTGRASGRASRANGKRSAPTTRCSRPRWPAPRGPAGAPGPRRDPGLSPLPGPAAAGRAGAWRQIAHFSHTPWAPPDYYRMLPDDVGREVLAGILGADHAGFLCRRWADAFADCCAAFLGADVDASRSRVRYRGHVTSIGVHPLGVDAGQLRDRASRAGRARPGGRR